MNNETKLPADRSEDEGTACQVDDPGATDPIAALQRAATLLADARDAFNRLITERDQLRTRAETAEARVRKLEAVIRDIVLGLWPKTSEPLMDEVVESLPAEVVELKNDRDEAKRETEKWVGKWTSMRNEARDLAMREAAEARAEADRMRPVAEAAQSWTADYECSELETAVPAARLLFSAVVTYEKLGTGSETVGVGESGTPPGWSPGSVGSNPATSSPDPDPVPRLLRCFSYEHIAHSGPGWYYHDPEYPEEGSVFLGARVDLSQWYPHALGETEQLVSENPEPDSDDGRRLDLLSALVEVYEKATCGLGELAVKSEPDPLRTGVQTVTDAICESGNKPGNGLTDRECWILSNLVALLNGDNVDLRDGVPKAASPDPLREAVERLLKGWESDEATVRQKDLGSLRAALAATRERDGDQ